MKRSKLLMIFLFSCVTLIGVSQEKKSVVTTRESTGLNISQNELNTVNQFPETNLNKEEIERVFKAHASNKDVNDKYLGLDDAILSLLTVSKLPLSVPEKGSADPKVYKKMLFGWLKDNMNIIKSEYLISK